MKDKWEIRSDDIIIFEELGHGAFGEVFKGIMKNPLCMTHGSIVHKTTKKAAKSTITVAIKMLHGMLVKFLNDMRKNPQEVPGEVLCIFLGGGVPLEL